MEDEWRRRCRADDLVQRGRQPPGGSELPVVVLAALHGEVDLDAVVEPALGLAQEGVTASEAIRQTHLLGEAVMGSAVHSNDDAVRLLQVLSRGTEAIARNYLGRLSEEARRDAVTALPTRNVLEEDLQGAVARVASRGGSFSIAFCDADGLKVANNEYSHRTGDFYLRVFAIAFTDLANAHDGRTYRYGGDEFIIVFRDPRGDVAELMQSLCEDPDVPPFSFGTVACPDDGDVPEELLHEADERMYKMKKSQEEAARWASARDWIEAHRSELDLEAT